MHPAQHAAHLPNKDSIGSPDHPQAFAERADGCCMSPQSWSGETDAWDLDDEETAWLRAEEMSAIHAALSDDGDDDDLDADDPRERDLAPRAPVPSPRSELRLTDAQRRVAGDWGDVPRRAEEVLLPVHEIMGEPLSTTGPVHEDASRERATRFLREHDPALTPAGVRAEVDRALEAAGVARDVLPEAFKPGKPSAARLALRAVIRDALTEVFEADRRRDFMAEALGCSTKALRGLMT